MAEEVPTLQRSGLVVRHCRELQLEQVEISGMVGEPVNVEA